MPIIQEGMSKDKKWRFRYLIAENILKIISDLSKEKINEYFYDIIIKLFGDHAEEIRKTAWKIIEKIVNIMDKDFMENKIWEAEKEQLKSTNYILRIASLKSVDYLKKYYKKEFINNIIIPHIIESVKDDKIPNVKFSACQVLSSLVNYLGKDKKIKNIVEEYISSLKNDKDEDVVFFSQKAIQDLKN